MANEHRGTCRKTVGIHWPDRHRRWPFTGGRIPRQVPSDTRSRAFARGSTGAQDYKAPLTADRTTPLNSPVTFGDTDAYLFREGTHSRLYERLGGRLAD